LLATKLLIKVNKILENKKVNKNKLILILNKILNIFSIYLISFLLFLIFNYIYFLDNKINIFFVLVFAQFLDTILLFYYLVF